MISVYVDIRQSRELNQIVPMTGSSSHEKSEAPSCMGGKPLAQDAASKVEVPAHDTIAHYEEPVV